MGPARQRQSAGGAKANAAATPKGTEATTRTHTPRHTGRGEKRANTKNSSAEGQARSTRSMHRVLTTIIIAAAIRPVASRDLLAFSGTAAEDTHAPHLL